MKKNDYIETLRGIAILLLVLYHTCEFLNLPDRSLLRQTHIPFDYLRLPLFTVISGFVYALRPVTREQLAGFARKKFLRLAIPLFTWTSLSFLFFTLVYEGAFTWKSYLSKLLMPYLQFWFLQVLIVIFGLIALLEIYGAFRTVRRWAVCLAGSLLVLFFYVYIFPGTATTPLKVMSFFSHSGVFFLLPFFILGLGIQRFFYLKLSRLHMGILCGVFVLGLLSRELYALDLLHITHLQKDGMIGMIVGLANTLFVMNLRIRNKALIYLGARAYPLYLTHVLALLFPAFFLAELGVTNPYLLFPALALSGVLIPLALIALIEKSAPARLLFFGTRRKSTVSAPKVAGTEERPPLTASGS